MKSELHPVCSTAVSSPHVFSMNLFSRLFVFLWLTAVGLVSITTVSAQKLPDTTRLLRFPAPNGTQIVFCYAGETYTVGNDGGIAWRLASSPGHSPLLPLSPDGPQIA